MIDPVQNQAIVPRTIIVYYKNEPQNNPQPLAEGLRRVAGYDLAGDRTRDAFSWTCQGRAASSTIGSCGPGKLIASMQFPQCWDGVNLDSADHRSHVSYKGQVAGKPACPATHPVELPRITYNVYWDVRAGESTASWRLSTDTHTGVTPPGGTTFNADWFGGWNKTFSDRWCRVCVLGFWDCNAGQPGSQLGDGGQLAGAAPSPCPARTPIPVPPVRPQGVSTVPSNEALTLSAYSTINPTVLK